jgi:Helix-turn-helix domain of resolvase
MGGRPTVWTPAKLKVARSMYAGGEHDVATIARVVGVSRASVYRALAPGDPDVRNTAVLGRVDEPQSDGVLMALAHRPYIHRMNPVLFSLAISFLALLVAGYGIIERRQSSNRADRLRLSVITGELATIRLQLVETAAEGYTMGDRIEALNSRVELLAQQALALISEHALTVTSTECREVALALENSGYRDDSEDIWLLAQEHAHREGPTQDLYATRGFAYFLFREERIQKARELLGKGIDAHTIMNDNDRLQVALTLRQWAVWEQVTSDNGSEFVKQLHTRIELLAAQCTTLHGQEMTIAMLPPSPPETPGAAPG